MDEFKHVFNAITLYDTLFIKIDTEAEDNNSSIENDIWNDFMSRKYQFLMDKHGWEHIHVNKTRLHPEFSKITKISYGVVLKDDKVVLRDVQGNDEKELIENFFNILEIFRSKKLDGYLCGHNILGYEIPFLAKRGIKYGLKLPKSFKNNLTAKPWEYTIIDIINLWKFTGNDYIQLNAIALTLGIQTVAQPTTHDNLNLIIEIYRKLREM